MKPPTLAITITIPLHRAWDVWVSAIEGGIGYWSRLGYGGGAASTRDDRRRAAESLGVDAMRHFDACTDAAQLRYFAPFVEGGYVELLEIDEFAQDDDGHALTIPHRVDGETIMRGFALLALKFPRHLALVLDGEDDATTADLVVQLGVFGEVRYG
jgi:hypothetical protein